jgi:hypothetical protein
MNNHILRLPFIIAAISIGILFHITRDSVVGEEHHRRRRNLFKQQIPAFAGMTCSFVVWFYKGLESKNKTQPLRTSCPAPTGHLILPIFVSTLSPTKVFIAWPYAEE